MNLENHGLYPEKHDLQQCLDICNTFARCLACHWVLSTELCLQLHGQQLAWGSPLQGLQSASANAPSKMPSYIVMLFESL